MSCLIGGDSWVLGYGLGVTLIVFIHTYVMYRFAKEQLENQRRQAQLNAQIAEARTRQDEWNDE